MEGQQGPPALAAPGVQEDEAGGHRGRCCSTDSAQWLWRTAVHEMEALSHQDHIPTWASPSAGVRSVTWTCHQWTLELCPPQGRRPAQYSARWPAPTFLIATCLGPGSGQHEYLLTPPRRCAQAHAQPCFCPQQPLPCHQALLLESRDLGATLTPRVGLTFLIRKIKVASLPSCPSGCERVTWHLSFYTLHCWPQLAQDTM